MPSLIPLLRAASRDRPELALADFSERQIQWVVEAGLAPLLYRYLADAPAARASPAFPLVKGADLAARLIAADHLDAMDAILRACEGRIRPLTLLKGISVAGQLYPEPHLRPMRDIDVLATPDAVPTVEAALRELGYHQESKLSREFYDTHHHTTPFRDPRTGVWVEVHRGLCPAWSPVASDALFGLERIRAEEKPSALRGRAVYRLSEELQLVYLAAHWAYDFRMASGLVAMLDTIYLLGSAQSLRWERILSWLENARAATPVYLLLTYLDRHALVRLPPGLLDELARRQRSFGRASLRLLHAMIDRYVTNGRELGWVVSERNFSILWQSLLLPRPELRKLLVIMKRLLPSRRRLTRWSAEPSAAGPGAPRS